MNPTYILLSIGVDNLFDYSLKDIVIIAFGIFGLIELFRKAKSWINNRKNETYEEINGETSLKTTVTTDHDRLGLLEKQVLAIGRGVKEILRTDLMEAHDKCMSRKPFPYITRYERLMHITMYDAYAELESDPVIEGFHKEMLELTVHDDGFSPNYGDNAGDI